MEIHKVAQAAGQAAAMVEIAEAVAATLARTVQRKAVTAEVLEQCRHIQEAVAVAQARQEAEQTC